MDLKPGTDRSLDADDFYKVLAAVGETEKDAEKLLLTDRLADQPVEKLSTENARLEAEAAKALPESPWYLAILMVALVGVLAGFLFLIR